jgi:hypothetical protein
MLLNKKFAHTVLAILVPLLAVLWIQMLLSVDLGVWATVILVLAVLLGLAYVWWPRRETPGRS